MNLILIKNDLRVDIGILDTNIAPHWAYYIAGSIFIVFFIVSIIYTYYFITHPYSKKNLNELHGFKKFKIKNRVSFFIMSDIICLLSAIIFMMNGS